jgi:hypothetical protein
MVSISPDAEHQGPEELTIYNSRAFLRLKNFKQDLVLSLFLRRGHFWEMVWSLREKRSITAKVQLPPLATESWMEPMKLLPADAPEYPGFHAPNDDKGDYYRFVSHWPRDVGTILSAVLPNELWEVLDYRFDDLHYFYNREYLRTFCAACVLYDPPETELLAFAAYHDPPAYPADHSTSASQQMTRQAKMKMNSIEKLPIRREELGQQRAFYESLLLEIANRLEPHGIDLRSMIEDIHRDRPELKDGLSKELETRFYINVGEHTTRDDVVGAYHTIATTLRKPPARTKPRRNRLVAVQCAILHDHHNRADTSDGRRRTWAYKHLAKKFGLFSERSAKAHVELGRELLNNK